MASAARATTDARTRARTRRVEEDVLLTAVMCLLAYGAVMVYSASSANTVIQGGGDGTGYLLRYVLYGALGLGAMWFVARRPLAQVLRAHRPAARDRARLPGRSSGCPASAWRSTARAAGSAPAR